MPCPEVARMRSLFLRIFLWFWLTVILVGVALLQTDTGPGSVVLREQLFARLLPSEARASAQIFESSGAVGLSRHLDELEAQFPIQTFFFGDDSGELGGRRAPLRIQDLARLSTTEDRLYVIVNLAAHRATGPSGKTYSLVILQEPSEQFRQRNRTEMKRLLGFELPAIIFVASGLFCYFSARYVTRPILSLRAAAAGISEGHLETRVDPRWKRRKDEIGELSRDFDRMAERIEALVAGQKRLLGDVSHELRSPLSRLMVALELVALELAKQRPQAEAAELLDRIGTEARRLDKLIGQLLTLARIDSGMHAGAQPFDLASVVEEVARDAGFEARAAGREVAVTSMNQCAVSGSEELIRSAVENVVRNAVRHTRGGTQVEISLEARGEFAILTVRDHGPGVPEQALTEIFLPFRRIPSGDSMSDRAGLGLAIVERAVRLHGGRVHAANAADAGLIVEIELPTPRASR
jgi:two-component system, OmpR family, sensor histidine kinase CpxA